MPLACCCWAEPCPLPAQQQDTWGVAQLSREQRAEPKWQQQQSLSHAQIRRARALWTSTRVRTVVGPPLHPWMGPPPPLLSKGLLLPSKQLRGACGPAAATLFWSGTSYALPFPKRCSDPHPPEGHPIQTLHLEI